MSNPRISDIFRLGVRQKVILVLLAVLTVAMTVSGWMLFRSQRVQLEHESQQNSEYIMRYVSRSLAYSVVGYDYHSIQLLLNELVQFDDIAYARVLSPKGNAMAEAGARPAQDAGVELMGADIELDGENVGRLELGISNARIAARLDEQRSMLIRRELLIILLIAIGEFLALSYIIVRPVTIISRGMTASASGSGTIDSDIEFASHDEFGEMAGRFNQMRHRLNEANSQLQSRIVAANRRLESTNRELIQQSNRLRRANEELKRLSITDGLTGLFNRRQFESLLGSEVETSLRYDDSYSIILIDLDHFKEINDRFGHDAGDDALRETATLVRSMTRKSDVVCRIGGEEFVVLCKYTDKAASLGIARKILARLAATPLHTASGPVSLTASAGVATIPGENTPHNAETFLKNADQALYHSKQQGRNRVTHYSDIAPLARTGGGSTET